MKKYIIFSIIIVMALVLTSCDKKPSDTSQITSPAQLTDELTGKGEISMGDTLEHVKEVLAKQGFDVEDPNYIPGGDGSQYYINHTCYYLDGQARIMAIEGTSIDFETSRGLKLGDTVKKMKELYGTKFEYKDGGKDASIPPRYFYQVGEGGELIFTIEPGGKDDEAHIIEITFGGFDYSKK